MHIIHMHHLITMHHNQIYFIHISILTKYSDQVQPRSHFYNLSIAHNVHNKKAAKIMQTFMPGLNASGAAAVGSAPEGKKKKKETRRRAT